MKMMCACILFLMHITICMAGQRASQRDTQGNTQHQKPSYTAQQNGRIVETDATGNKQYHRQQYLMKDGKVYQTDSLGNVQYHKPSFAIQNDGKVVEHNSSVNAQYHHQQYNLNFA